jgi:hypothetical protein
VNATDMELGPDHALYVINNSLSPDAGEVVRIALPTTTTTLGANQDNTLYESETGALSNGAGDFFFSGTTGDGSIRRGLVSFDMSAGLPTGSTVVSASLELHMSRTIAGPQDVSAHFVSAQWGEGDSDADGEEGAGAPAATGDATWLHTKFDTETWVQPGGDYSAAPSATTAVDDVGDYAWSSAALAGDVQAWLDTPDASNGWALVGVEGSDSTAKRFNTSENDDAATRPRLVIEYIAPLPPEAAFLPFVTFGE